MKNIIYFMKDESIIRKKKITSSINYKYIGVPAGDVNQSYLIFKSLDHFNTFTKAFLSYQMIITKHSDIDSTFKETHTFLEEVSTEHSSIIGLIQSLHSLNKIRLCNSSSNSNECYEYLLIEFVSFRLEVFANNDKIFQYIFNGSENDKLGPEDLLERIKPIYNPISRFPSKKDYLYIYNDKWSFTNVLQTDGIVGIHLPDTKSVAFFPGSFMFILEQIKSIYCASYIYDKENAPFDYSPQELSDLVLGITTDNDFSSIGFRFHDLWTPYINYSFEYLVYLPDIYSNLLVISEIESFGKVTGDLYMSSYIDIIIYNDDYVTKELHLDCDSKHILSMREIIQKIVEYINSIE